jgi:hypothetical protein
MALKDNGHEMPYSYMYLLAKRKECVEKIRQSAPLAIFRRSPHRYLNNTATVPAMISIRVK